MTGYATAAAAQIGLPTRVIGYAWGDTYLDELLNIALPALLAPGNLPAVAARVPCELVLVSEKRLFAKITAHPAVREAQKLAPVRLIGLDDLITRSDKYGMALTYALHRGFVDLGPAMTDTWLIFFNADFILADGSLRNLLDHLMRGEHIVASPSYCTVKEDVLPELKRRRARDPTRLAIAPRDLADLILRHRHLTIRGKTVNQDKFHLLQADQFYWQVDGKTMVGQQMPVAIVGMRPQRYLPEPNAFWDHGLMLELCPDAEVKLLGDSDEFLMLELRGGGVAKDQIVRGPPDPRDLAERMVTWVTPYQASFAHRRLVLHAGDIPAAAEAAHQELDAFVTEVLSYAVPFPSHVDHPQWDYHWPDFMKIRHEFLSTTFGSRTETEPPPATMLAIDQLWWRLDGAEKAYARRIGLLASALEKIDQEIATNATKMLAEIAAPKGTNATRDDLFARKTLDVAAESAPAAGDNREILELIDRTLSKNQYEAEARKAKIRNAITAAEEEYAANEELRQMRSQYVGMLQSRVKSAGIPMVHWRAGQEFRAARKKLPARKKLAAEATPAIVRWRAGQEFEAASEMLPIQKLATKSRIRVVHWRAGHGFEVAQEKLPAAENPAVEAWHRRARKAYYRIFGRWPRVTILNPFWVCAQPLLEAIEAAKADGACDALVIADTPGVSASLTGLPGKIAQLSPAGLGWELLSKALEPQPRFDLCVLQLGVDDFPRLAELLSMLDPYMRPGATIVGFCMNGGQPVGGSTLSDRKWWVAFTGSAASMRAIRLYSLAPHYLSRRRLFSIARGLLMLGLSMALALCANLYEMAVRRRGRPPDPTLRTSVTIFVKCD
jgi:hypothetical protein